MANVDLTTIWTMRLTSEEFILVLRALGGRMKGEAEVSAAKALGDRLAVQKAALTDDRLRQNQKLVDNLRDAGLEVVTGE
jgi:hypothetical protein